MNRFTQVFFDNGQLSNYKKYIDHPVLPLAIALEPLLSSIDKLDYCIKFAKNNCYFPSIRNLTIEESAAIYLYAEELHKPTLNSALNQALRSRNESMIEPWFGFLKLFNTALEKLPTVSRTIWRGMHIDIAKSLRENEVIIWGCVSSCSSSMNTIGLYLDANSVLCSIEAINGKYICGYTRYSKEDEILLLPGTRLRVKKNGYDVSIGRRVVQLVEICTDNFISSSDKPPEINSGNNLISFLKIKLLSIDRFLYYCVVNIYYTF
jgi:hypothetical protein